MSLDRITDLMTATATNANLSEDLNRLTQTEDELSSGKTINQPSDNPYGASVVVSLNTNLSQQSSYSANITDGTNWLNTAGGALTDIENMVQTVRELAVEGANGTNSASDDQNAAQEVNQLIAAVKQAANTSYDGQYIFSGTATGTAPYQAGSTDTYQGNSGTISREIGANETVQVNSNISSVLGNGGSDGLLLSSLRQIASDLSSGSSSALTSLGTSDLQNLDTNLSSLQQMQSNVGALTNRLSIASSAAQTMTADDNTELASTEDANMATLATDYSTESAGYQAALQAGAQIIQQSLLNFLSS
jgi:flagellar hook-associated protein 3 FlgL